MNTEKIILGEATSKRGINEDNFIDVNLSNSERELPFTDDSYTLDEYKQYVKEKDESEKYRLAFTITPYCTNVLFNVITEVVYEEGSDDCKDFTISGVRQNDKTFYPFLGEQGMYLNKSSCDKDYLTRNTSFSHPSLSSGVCSYHCGYNIFNNHFFRSKTPIIVSPIKTNSGSGNGQEWFNTLFDYQRDRDGNVRQHSILKLRKNSDNKYELSSPSTETPLHVYLLDTVKSYEDAITDNLKESNGWLGFENKAIMPIVNVSGCTKDGKKYYGSGITINKCMNDREAGDFVDMYPDRTLYSFVPKYNEHRKRVEPNWDYCITYPYAKDTCYLTEGGLKCIMITELSPNLTNLPKNITFKTLARHNFHDGDMVSFAFTYNNETVKKSRVDSRVVSTGLNGEDGRHYFTIKVDGILNEICQNTGGGTTTVIPKSNYKDIRVIKVDGGINCEYYIRKFKKIKTYNSSLNKLAFAQNAYSDQVAQIVFTEDINTKGLRDHLNRPLSELYLTIIKRNKGHNKWYTPSPRDCGSPDIEYSHCFGRVSDGFELPTDSEAFQLNAHRLHNVIGHEIPGVTDGVQIPFPSSSITTGGNITIDKDEFFGDIVEFSPYTLEETVLENVYFRFNTAQREFTASVEYGNFYIDSINNDDYDYGAPGQKFWGSSAATSVYKFGKVNVLPEGYMYRAHYPVKIKEFKEEVNVGYHIKVNYNIESKIGAVWTINTDKNYYFQPAVDGKYEGTLVYAYTQEGELICTGNCTGVGGSNFNIVTIRFQQTIGSDDIILFKHNTEMPDGAYDMKDGTGKYVWRDVASFGEISSDSELFNSQFTNGAHYFHKNISFYLKRQDPDGSYGLGNSPKELAKVFIIGNESKDVSYSEYYKESGEIKC